MTSQCRYYFSADHIPELDRFIPTTRGDQIAIRAEESRCDLLVMTIEGLDLVTGSNSPDPDGPVVTARDQPLTIGAESDRSDFTRVPTQRLNLYSSFRFPEFDLAVPAA